MDDPFVTLPAFQAFGRQVEIWQNMHEQRDAERHEQITRQVTDLAAVHTEKVTRRLNWQNAMRLIQTLILLGAIYAANHGRDVGDLVRAIVEGLQ
jgi:hypothetical protein